MPNQEERGIDEILLESGKLSITHLKKALELKRTTKASMEEVLIKYGFVEEEDVLKAIGQKYQVKFLDLDKFPLDKKLVLSIPKNLMIQYQVLPLKVVETILFLGMSDPGNIRAIEDFKRVTGLQIKVVLCQKKKIQIRLQSLLGKTEDGVTKSAGNRVNPMGDSLQKGTPMTVLQDNAIRKENLKENPKENPKENTPKTPFSGVDKREQPKIEVKNDTDAREPKLSGEKSSQRERALRDIEKGFEMNQGTTKQREVQSQKEVRKHSATTSRQEIEKEVRMGKTAGMRVDSLQNGPENTLKSKSGGEIKDGFSATVKPQNFTEKSMKTKHEKISNDSEEDGDSIEEEFEQLFSGFERVNKKKDAWGVIDEDDEDEDDIDILGDFQQLRLATREDANHAEEEEEEEELGDLYTKFQEKLSDEKVMKKGNKPDAGLKNTENSERPLKGTPHDAKSAKEQSTSLRSKFKHDKEDINAFFEEDEPLFPDEELSGFKKRDKKEPNAQTLERKLSGRAEPMRLNDFDESYNRENLQERFEKEKGSMAPKQAETEKGNMAPKQAETEKGLTAPKQAEKEKALTAPKQFETEKGSMASKQFETEKGSMASKQFETEKGSMNQDWSATTKKTTKQTRQESKGTLHENDVFNDFFGDKGTIDLDDQSFENFDKKGLMEFTKRTDKEYESYESGIVDASEALEADERFSKKIFENHDENLLNDVFDRKPLNKTIFDEEDNEQDDEQDDEQATAMPLFDIQQDDEEDDEQDNEQATAMPSLDMQQEDIDENEALEAYLNDDFKREETVSLENNETILKTKNMNSNQSMHASATNAGSESVTQREREKEKIGAIKRNTDNIDYDVNLNQKPLFKEKIGSYMVKSGYITEAQLEDALVKQKKTGELLGKILVKLGYIKRRTLYGFLEKQLGVKYVDLESVDIKPDIFNMVNESIARSHSLVPFEKENNVLKVAMSDPLNIFSIDDLRIGTGLDIQPFLADDEQIRDCIDIYYEKAKGTREVYEERKKLDNLDEEFQRVNEEIAFENQADVASDVLALESDSVTDAPIVKLLNIIFQGAVARRASDIHIEPHEDRVIIRYRVDGELIEVMEQESKVLPAMVARVKIISGLNIAEKRLPQDGRISIVILKKAYDMRVSVLPTMFGEKVVIRIADKEGFNVKKEHLGFFGDDLKKFDKILENPHGIVLVTGPTGSGKSTTLYTALKELSRPNVNILTVEDPVEATVKGVNQVQVNVKAGLDFAKALRAFLRQDPDIIMVGEIRDGETAEIAIRAAITGHLVLSTLHTNDAPSTISRVIDMGIEPYMVSSSLVGVIAQRLVRRLCKKCKRIKMPDLEERKVLGINDEEDLKIYEPVGCDACNQVGYKGRIAVHEIMTITRGLRDLITKNASSDELRDLALKNGMKTLRDNCVRLIKAGVTSVEEMYNISHSDE